MELRVNKLISEALSTSRRDAEEYIKAGRVKINDRVAKLSDLVNEKDIVLFDQVDLPVADIIRQSVTDSKQDKFESKVKNKSKSKREEIAESQRIQASPKSAALRKTSKNNPENKNKVMKMRKNSWDEEDDDRAGGFHKKNKSHKQKTMMSSNRGKSNNNWSSKGGAKSKFHNVSFDDDF